MFSKAFSECIANKINNHPVPIYRDTPPEEGNKKPVHIFKGLCPLFPQKLIPLFARYLSIKG